MDCKKYMENLEAYGLLDQITFPEGTPKETVIQALIDNSNKKREIATENNAILNEYLYKYIKYPELLNDETVKGPEELLNSLLIQNRYPADAAIAIELTELLYSYYAGKRDYSKTAMYLAKYAMSLTIENYHLDNPPKNPFYSLVKSLIPHYEEMDENGKKVFLDLYGMSIVDRNISDFDFDRYKEFMKFAEDKKIDAEHNRATILATTNTFSVMQEILTQNHRRELWGKEPLAVNFTMEEYEKICQTAKKLMRNIGPEYRLQVDVFEPEIEYNLGKISKAEAMDKFEHMEISTEGFPPMYKVRFELLPFTTEIAFMQRNQVYPRDVEKKKCEELVQRAYKKVEPYIHQSTDTQINYSLLMLLAAACDVLGLEHYSSLLEKITIQSNKPLFIHTRMVTELSLAIFDFMYEENPEYFIGVKGYDASYVREHGSELRELLHKSAMLHDFGKFFINDIIGNSSRRLTDYEFFLIQHHPINMTDIYAAPPTENEKVIIDVSLLHHLWFNEEGGYPKGYHHTGNKPFLNIVSIADSIDAATDYIGRPYAKRKTVDDIVNEIASMKGTRYDSVVAEEILKPELKEKIRKIIEERRTEINYEVYAGKTE